MICPLAGALAPNLLLILIVPFPSQVEAMKEVGVFFSGLVQELAGLREAAVQDLHALQTEHDQLEDEIRRAQEKHQTVRAGGFQSV